MGIQGLTKLLLDRSPSCIKHNPISSYFGRKIAIDASMSIYQFLIAVRQQDGSLLQNENGETTSHLMGLFYRTIRMVDNGLKPVYVFDGKPPTMKGGELAKRIERRAEAQSKLEEAKEAGDTALVDKFSRRTVKVSQEHNNECKRLLKVMGIPYVEAPCEAEAQCAALAKAGKVFAAASEDMDTLTFSSPVLLRHLTYSEAKKMPIDEFHLDKALLELELNMDEFIDLCILLGCDYTDSIKGIGPHRAFNLIKEHKNIETILKHLDPVKYPVPTNFNFEEARKLFNQPEVKNCEEIELKWNSPDEVELLKFLVDEKGFSKERVIKGMEKLKSKVNVETQSRLDSFFKPIAKEGGGDKRKVIVKKSTSNVKKTKTGSKPRR